MTAYLVAFLLRCLLYDKNRMKETDMIYDGRNIELLDLMPESDWDAIEQAAFAAHRHGDDFAEDYRRDAGYDSARISGLGRVEGMDW